MDVWSHYDKDGKLNTVFFFVAFNMKNKINEFFSFGLEMIILKIFFSVGKGGRDVFLIKRKETSPSEFNWIFEDLVLNVGNLTWIEKIAPIGSLNH